MDKRNRARLEKALDDALHEFVAWRDIIVSQCFRTGRPTESAIDALREKAMRLLSLYVARKELGHTRGA